jgi:hypothetical protein
MIMGETGFGPGWDGFGWAEGLGFELESVELNLGLILMLLTRPRGSNWRWNRHGVGLKGDEVSEVVNLRY